MRPSLLFLACVMYGIAQPLPLKIMFLRERKGAVLLRIIGEDNDREMNDRI